jgi:hypothetical protein
MKISPRKLSANCSRKSLQNLVVVVHVARVCAVRVGKDVILDEQLDAGDLQIDVMNQRLILNFAPKGKLTPGSEVVPQGIILSPGGEIIVPLGTNFTPLGQGSFKLQCEHNLKLVVYLSKNKKFTIYRI